MRTALRYWGRVLLLILSVYDYLSRFVDSYRSLL